jgi:hypothetical protein
VIIHAKQSHASSTTARLANRSRISFFGLEKKMKLFPHTCIGRDEEYSIEHRAERGIENSSHIMAAAALGDTISLLFLLKGIGKKY